MRVEPNINLKSQHDLIEVRSSGGSTSIRFRRLLLYLCANGAHLYRRHGTMSHPQGKITIDQSAHKRRYKHVSDFLTISKFVFFGLLSNVSDFIYGSSSTTKIPNIMGGGDLLYNLTLDSMISLKVTFLTTGKTCI